jgi:hypothetical protein
VRRAGAISGTCFSPGLNAAAAYYLMRYLLPARCGAVSAARVP